MGKIFDALERSDKSNIDSARVSVRVKKSRRSKKAPKNVVPLVSSTAIKHKSQMDRTLVAYYDPQSVEAEMFKVLRTNILFPDSHLPPKTILITSALPDDGKTFVSANLAISIAQGVEDHVLLIDADIRKPDIHSRFGFKMVPGLSEHLLKGDNISDVMLKTAIDKLSILPAGKPPSNPTELISSKKMKKLLEEVKSRYNDRYVIIDSPPTSMAPETNAIAKYVDGVILVVKAGKTPRNAVAETIEQIGKEKIIGIVLNKADKYSKKYYGYSKTYY